MGNKKKRLKNMLSTVNHMLLDANELVDGDASKQVLSDVHLAISCVINVECMHEDKFEHRHD